MPWRKDLRLRPHLFSLVGGPGVVAAVRQAATPARHLTGNANRAGERIAGAVVFQWAQRVEVWFSVELVFTQRM